MQRTKFIHHIGKWRILLLFLIILLDTQLNYAQSYLQRIYGSSQYAEKVNKGVVVDGKIFVVTDSRENTSLNSSLRVLEMDTNLVIQNSRDFRSAGTLQCTNIIALNDSELLVIGRCIDTVSQLNNISTMLLLLNAQLDTIWTNRIFKSNSDADLNYVSNRADSIILFGYMGSHQNNTSKPAFIFIDKQSGDLTGFYKYDSDSINGGLFGVQSIYLNYDSRYYCVSFFQDTVTFSHKILLSKFDLGFNPIKSMLLETNIGYLTGILAMKTHILINYSVYLPGYDACLTQLDTSLNVNWSNKYGGPLFDEIFRFGIYNNSDKIQCALFEKIVTLDSTGNIESLFPVVEYNLSPFSTCQVNQITPLSNNSSFFLASIRTLGSSSEDMLISKSRSDGSGCSTNGSSLPTVSRIVTSNVISIHTISDSLGASKDITSTIDSASIITICSTAQSLWDHSDERTIKIWPNPANDNINVSLKVKTGGTYIREIQIHDLSGQLLTFKTSLRSTTDIMDVSKLATGIYLLTVTTNHQTEVLKLVVNKGN
ncbi:MAG: T9SS type A sorting domain-containing protein [Bacteroidia bacterium]